MAVGLSGGVQGLGMGVGGVFVSLCLVWCRVVGVRGFGLSLLVVGVWEGLEAVCVGGDGFFVPVCSLECWARVVVCSGFAFGVGCLVPDRHGVGGGSSKRSVPCGAGRGLSSVSVWCAWSWACWKGAGVGVGEDGCCGRVCFLRGRARMVER